MRKERERKKERKKEKKEKGQRQREKEQRKKALSVETSGKLHLSKQTIMLQLDRAK